MKISPEWKRILIGLFVSLLAIAVILYLVDLSLVIDELRSANILMASSVFVFTLAWVAVRSAVWRTLLQEKATFGQVFLTVNEGYLINNVLPLRLGEVARSFLLSRKAGLGFWQVFSTILIERALDLMMAAGFLLASLPFVVNASWAAQAAIGVGALVVAGLLSLYLMARYQVWVLRQFERLMQRWPALNKFGSQQLSAFLDGLTVLTDGRRFLLAIAWMITNWLFAILQYYVLLLAFFPEAKPLWAAFCLGFVALGMAAPSSPGALGVMELAWITALSFFGAEQEAALAAAVLARVANYIITGVLGAYGLTVDGISLFSLFRQVKGITSETTTNQPTPENAGQDSIPDNVGPDSTPD
ncbi:lysylphosphatidylglycerol synthase transmembrane domain-containing protein [Chloroflexota bacterium]